MKTKVPVYKIMTPLPIRLNPKDSIQKAAFIMNDLGIRHLPVVKDSEVIGIISYSDILRINELDREKILSDNLMTTPAITIKESETLEELAPLFTTKKLHAVPVLDYENKLIGIVSTIDIIKFMYDYIQTEKVWEREYQN